MESVIVSGKPCESLFPNELLHADHLPVSSRAVDVQLWELGEFRNHDASLPSLIDPCWINSQLALTTVSIGQNKTKVWATIDLAKVRDSNMVGDVCTYIITVTVVMDRTQRFLANKTQTTHSLSSTQWTCNRLRITRTFALFCLVPRNEFLQVAPVNRV
jgi:hypothetical protein